MASKNLGHVTAYAYAKNATPPYAGSEADFMQAMARIAEIPSAPAVDGSYKLVVTVVEGVATLSWEETYPPAAGESF